MRRDNNPAHLRAKIKGANKAIKQLGGSTQAAYLITGMAGKPCNRARVQAWKKFGIAPPWHPVIHRLTQIPLTELDPEIYPSFIFNQ